MNAISLAADFVIVSDRLAQPLSKRQRVCNLVYRFDPASKAVDVVSICFDDPISLNILEDVATVTTNITPL